MLKRTLILAAILLASSTPSSSQAVASRTRAHVEALASERLAGREAGSPGERLAADYIAQQLARVGARPLPGRSDMFATFEFTAGSRDGGTQVTIQRAAPGGVPVGAVSGVVAGARALSFSDDAEVSGEVVFAGYGIVVPEAQNFGYDS